MSVAATDVRAPDPLLVDVLGTALRGTSTRLAAHCLVEVEGGAVIGHALRAGPAPAGVMEAVLRRTCAPLAEASLRSRRSSVLPGGPLLVSRVRGGQDWVQVAPLQRGGVRIGWLWLISRSCLAAQDIAEELGPVASALPATVPDAECLAVAAAVTDGTALPREWVRAARQVWVVTLTGARPQDVRPALTSAAGTLRLLAVDDGERTRAVVQDHRGRGVDEIEARVKQAVAGAGLTLGAALRSGISEPADPAAALAPAVQQADAAWLMSWPGTCVCVRDVRSRFVLHVARSAVRELPELGPDPVVLLREHDRLRGTHLCRSVRAWLDADRDMATAADHLFVHTNTLRYRLKRAAAVMGRALDDVDLLIELHLRLVP